MVPHPLSTCSFPLDPFSNSQTVRAEYDEFWHTFFFAGKSIARCIETQRARTRLGTVLQMELLSAGFGVWATNARMSRFFARCNRWCSSLTGAATRCTCTRWKADGEGVKKWSEITHHTRGGMVWYPGRGRVWSHYLVLYVELRFDNICARPLVMMLLLFAFIFTRAMLRRVASSGALSPAKKVLNMMRSLARWRSYARSRPIHHMGWENAYPPVDGLAHPLPLGSSVKAALESDGSRAAAQCDLDVRIF